MNVSPSNAFVVQAVEALKALDRTRAVDLLKKDLATAPPGGERWLSFAKLTATIGERGMELEAMRRFSETLPQTLDHVLAYGQALARFNRSDEAIRLLNGLPVDAQSHPAVLHFRGSVFTEVGDFAEAESCFRRALVKTPNVAQIWYGLSVIKTFKPGDPDIFLMEKIRSDFDRQPVMARSLFLYALAKAWHDIGDFQKAAAIYDEGAALMAADRPYNTAGWRDYTTKTINDYTLSSISKLMPSGCSEDRVVFVTGLPRSGTTLVEQILTSHSRVLGGNELNLMDGMMLPAGDLSLSGALSYQARAGIPDPWGEIGRDYMSAVTAQLGPEGLVVDKTLSQSRLMGLLLHALPSAKVVWLRRNPEDCALSIFRTHFRNTLPWSWSLQNIASHMKSEDRLYAHWSSQFPDRILTVPYESLVSEPEDWIRHILRHAGLSEEPQVFAPHEQKRSVATASVAQVRAPISTTRVGSARAYGAYMDAFRQSYYA